jgi:hypothetical protein
MRGISIAENNDFSKTLSLTIRGEWKDEKLWFYLTSCRPEINHSKRKFLTKMASMCFSKLHWKKQIKDFILAKRTEGIPPQGISEYNDLIKIKNALGLPPELIERKIRSWIKRTLSPWKMEIEERLDWGDLYKGKEKTLWEDQYKFDLAVLRLLKECEKKLAYKSVQQGGKYLCHWENVFPPISDN